MKSKLLIYFLPVLLIGFLFYGYSAQDNPNTDSAPLSDASSNVKHINSAIGDTLYTFIVPNELILGVNKLANSPRFVFTSGGQSSAITTDNVWLRTDLYGNRIDSFPQVNNTSGQGFGFRDLTWDGKYLLTSDNSTIRRIDTTTFTEPRPGFTGPNSPNRGLAWSSVNRIWTSNFTTGPVAMIDTNGATIKSLGIPTVAPYGLAADIWTTPGRMWLWYSEPSTAGTIRLSKVDTSNGAIVQSFTYNFGAVASSGGLDIFHNHPAYPGRVIAIMVVQNSPTSVAAVIDIGPDGPPPPTCNYIWSTQASGSAAQFLSVSAVSDQIGWAGGVGPAVVRTTNGGTSWTSATGTGITGDIYSISAWSANDAICTTSPGATFIYKTTNGGTTWTQSYTLAGGFIDGLQMVSATEGYAMGDPVGGKWFIAKTTDGGASWARMATEPAQIGADAGWNNSFQISGTNMWFGTNGTKVYHSTDLGLTWTNGASTGTVNTYAVHFNDANKGMAGGTAMVMSTNGGTSYTGVTAPGTAGNLNGIDGAGSDWWALRSDANVYRSTNAGTSWTTAYTVTAAVFQDIDFKVVSGCPTGWVVGNGGAIAKMSVTGVGISLGSSEVPSSYSLKQNYPNPFNPTTNINFSIPRSGLVTLKVYDMVGREVASLVNEVKNAGSYIVGFNASNLPSGAYFYRVSAGDFVDTKKMLLIK